MFRHHPILAAITAALLIAPSAGAEPAGGGPPMPFATEAGTMPRIGERIDPARLHPVRRPGLYGIGEPPEGSRYGIVDGRLIRYDPGETRLLSIIRPVAGILD